MMQPRIETLNETKLVGKKLTMSFADNKTRELWQSFMPRRKEITNIVNNDLYSIEVYFPLFFTDFNPQAEFEKWAAVAVNDFNNVPNDFDTLTIPEGQYAVFIHKGPASEGQKTYGYILQEWLPKSEYILDERPHFALMGEKYKNDDPNSEEEIWIPIRART